MMKLKNGVEENKIIETIFTGKICTEEKMMPYRNKKAR